jgi:hypothetical protein
VKRSSSTSQRAWFAPAVQLPQLVLQVNAAGWYPAGHAAQLVKLSPQFGWQLAVFTPPAHEPHAAVQLSEAGW